MVSFKKVMESVLGGLLFGSVYFLCKYQLDLEYEGVQIESGSVLGQVFWFVKVAIGIIASKYASHELLGLMDQAEPMVEAAIDDGSSRRRSRSTSTTRAFVRKSPVVTRGTTGVTPKKHKSNCPCC